MKTAHELLVHGMEEMINTERKLVDALQEQEENATHPELKRAFNEHRKQTERQVDRLRQCFRNLEEEAHETAAAAVTGLIDGYRDFISRNHPSADITDVFSIAEAKKVENFETESYLTLINLARSLGYNENLELLEQNLKEEQETYQKLEHLSHVITPKDLGRQEIKKIA